MSTRVLISTAPSSTFPISTGSPDTGGLNSFAGVSVSRAIQTFNCKDLSLKFRATADWTGSAQWEEADRDPDAPSASPVWTLIPGTIAVVALTAAAGDNIQVPTKRCMWIRFNLVTQTGGGPLIPSVEGWGFENRPIL